jgi:ABC-type transport system involved in cytochrome c biogenesis permease subunit
MRFLYFLIGLLIFIQPVHAKTISLDMSQFRAIPIQHEGRIKPLESFARTLYKKLDAPPEDISAIDFLAEAFFNPAQSIQRPVFRIRSSTLKTRLFLDTERSYFSLTDLLPPFLQQEGSILALYKEEKLSQEEQLLTSLYERAIFLHHVTTTFNALLPLSIQAPEEFLELAGDDLPKDASFMDYKRYEEIILNYIEKHSPLSNNELELFIFQLSSVEQSMARQQNMRLLSNSLNNDSNALWLSPADMIIRGASSPEITTYLNMWKDMATAYRSNNAKRWKDATELAYGYVQEIAPAQVHPHKLGIEIQYLDLNPYLYSVIFCMLALVMLALHSYKPDLPLTPAIFCLIGAACLFHLTGIGMRMAILERPPVTNLYESILFVNAIILICTLFCAFFAQNKHIFLSIGALCGTLLFLTGRFFATRGDTLEVLIAVLDTNFWLTTHVLIITAGYGACLLTSCMAHYMLYLKNWGRQASPERTSLLPAIHILAIISLMLTTTGTILGGIWADQSWGRFWGWDPKENGALLIILWLIWVLHGRISGHLKNNTYLAGLAGLSIIVSLAWFGINLLGVGLHSYGFTSGIAWGLGLFCCAEGIIIAALTRLKKRGKGS